MKTQPKPFTGSDLKSCQEPGAQEQVGELGCLNMGSAQHEMQEAESSCGGLAPGR